MLRHSLTWETQKRDPIKQRDYLTFGLVRTGICVMLQAENQKYEYIANLPAIWKSPASEEDPDDTRIFGSALGKRLKSEKIRLLDTGQQTDFEWTTKNGSTYRFCIEIVFDRENGREIFTTVKDLTQERQRENVLRTLLKEVSHRSKNLLSMVQSLAFQTARHSESLERFIERFRGRIQSLSYSQDAITQTDWQGSKISQLVHNQKCLFSPGVQKLIHFEGEDVLLTPNATMHLGLALHELIANATNHGYFIEKKIPIKIVVSPAITAEECEMIAVEWTEHSAQDPFSEAEIKNLQDKQFGSTLLEKIVPTALSGKAQFVRDGELLKYRIEFPRGA